MGHFLGCSGKDKKRVTHTSCHGSCQPGQQGRGQLLATIAAPEGQVCVAVSAARAYSVRGLCTREGGSSSRVPAAGSRAATVQDGRVAPREGTAAVSPSRETMKAIY